MPHVLLIEDNPGDARLIRELLSEADTVTDTHTITHVERVEAAADLLAKPEHTFDVVLSDITLPDSSGVETLDTLTAAGAQLPVIFMTGTNNETLAIQAIQQGAQDYLVKGRHDGDMLARAIKYATERKKFQAELNLVSALAQANQQRAELLSQQKRQLLALNKAKDEFISLASHQLRTPATTVKQYLGMIVQGYMGDVDPNVFQLVQTAFDSNERQLSVINDLLKTAQLDADQYKLHIEPYDVATLIREVAEHIYPSFELRRQHLVLDDVTSAEVAIDHNEMYLVIENILGNASKYTPEGKTITVYTKRFPKKVQIHIKDEGVGISPADQKRVFDKFTRVDNALSDTVSGTGLGLYWAKRITRLHKGTIRIQSEIGKGTEFILSLPR